MNKFNSLNLFKSNKNQIFCRNLFLFLILIKYKNKNLLDKSTVFIKPYKKKIYTILRAPYRHKLSRHQLVLNRYNIISSIKMKTNNIFFAKNFKNVLEIFNFFKTFNMWFESNIIYNHRIKFSYTFYYDYNFILKNFNLKKLIKNK
jgi:hypothetical protein